MVGANQSIMNEKQKNKVIMEAIDPLNRTVKLFDHTWLHIISKHSDDFTSYEEIREVIENPLIIAQSEQKENRQFYYRYNSSTSNYSAVIVEDNTNSLFVVTAYKTDNQKVKFVPPIFYAKTGSPWRFYFFVSRISCRLFCFSSEAP